MSKYKNTKHGGYDSKKEARRASELAILQNEGRIAGLETQKVFTLIPRQMLDGRVKERAATYVADFTYCMSDGTFVVEDVKSDFTRKLPLYVLKRKLMLHVHGLAISEV